MFGLDRRHFDAWKGFDMARLVEPVSEFAGENAQCRERSDHIGRAIQDGFVQFGKRRCITNMIAVRVRHQQKIDFPEGPDIGLVRRRCLGAAGQPWVNHERLAARSLDPEAGLPQPQNFCFSRR